MEGARKRKSMSASTPSQETGAAKRLKLLNSSHAPTGNETVQKIGQRLIEQLHRASDKTGRLIADAFLSLPPRADLPDYYKVTKLPIAIDTIEDKLERNAYPTVTTLESDLKRMVQNAKDYNATGSDIYEDAERIRKLVYNYMKVHNPAYKDPNYSSFATPVPERGTPAAHGTHGLTNGGGDLEPRDASEQPRKSAPRSSMAPSADTGNDEDEAIDGESGIDFTGKTFQEAQKMIIDYMLTYTDDEGLDIYNPFGNLPTRKLEDYYKVIRYPVSLKGTRKRVIGQHGRNTPTGVSDFKNWDAFEEEVSWIWRNAREYNEDGSDMYTLATEFEDHFKRIIAEAREKVAEPAGPKLKLAGPKPKVTLNLSAHRNSPGVTVDNDALARQRQVVAAGSDSKVAAQRPAPVPISVPRSSSQHLTNGNTAPSRSPPEPVKLEKTTTQSPALGNALPVLQPTTNGMMPPPALRPSSSSPFPTQPLVSSYTYTAPALLPPTQIRAYPLEQALLPNVALATHPHLKLNRPFNMNIKPHETLSQQSRTITLPSSHYFLQISPTISKALSAGRPYKMFVTINGTRVTQRDTQFHQDTGRRTHVYEGSLAQGVNRIEVEVAAARDGGDGKGLDVEKVTVYANLMR